MLRGLGDGREFDLVREGNTHPWDLNVPEGNMHWHARKIHGLELFLPPSAVMGLNPPA